MKRITAFILTASLALSALTFSGVSAFAQDVAGEIILVSNLYYYNDGNPVYDEEPVAGELVLGENNITDKEGYYKFTVSKAGYYGIEGMLLRIVTLGEEGKTETFYFEDSDYWHDSVTRSNGKSYDIFYVEEPGVFYAEFMDDNGRREFVYFGELESFETAANPLEMESDIELIWPEGDSSTVCIKEVNLTFSCGETCLSSCYGSIDAGWKPGTHTFYDSISNGPEYTVEINLSSVAELIDRVELPDKYDTLFFNHFTAPEIITMDDEIEELLWDKCVDIYYKDGTVRRVELEENDNEFTAVILSDSGKEHYIILRYDEYEQCFKVSIDCIKMNDLPVYNTSSPLVDFTIYTLISVWISKWSARFLTQGTSPAQATSFYFDNMSDLTKQFIEYNKSLPEGGNYIPLPVYLALSELSDIFN